MSDLVTSGNIQEREELPLSLQYGRLRPMFVQINTTRMTPTSGFGGYNTNQDVVWAMPVGERMWLDGTASYITFECSHSRPTISTNYFLDKDFQAIVRKWRVVQNGTIVEDLESYNVIHNLILKILPPTMATLGGRNIDCGLNSAYNFIQDAGDGTTTGTTSKTMFAPDQITHYAFGIQTTTTTFSGKLYPPSTIVGMYQPRMVSLSWLQSLNIYMTLETKDIAYVTGNASTDDTNDFTYKNWYWYLSIYSLQGDIMALVSEAYMTGDKAFFYYPCSQWIHRQQVISSGTLTASIPLQFNVASAKFLVAVLRDQSRLAADSTTRKSWSLSDFNGGVQQYNWYVNGASYPSFGPVECGTIHLANTKGGLYTSSTFANLTTETTNVTSAGCDYDCPPNTTTNSYLDYSKIANRFGLEAFRVLLRQRYINLPYYLNQMGTRWANFSINNSGGSSIYPEPTSGDFFMAILWEPDKCTDSFPARGGVKLAASQDIVLQITFISATTVTQQLDVFCYSDIEIQQAADQIIRIGGL